MPPGRFCLNLLGLLRICLHQSGLNQLPPDRTPGQCSGHNFDDIHRGKGKDAHRQGIPERAFHLIYKPRGAKSIGHRHAQHQADHRPKITAPEPLDKKAPDQRQKEEADQITSGRTGQLAQPPGISRENRQPHQSQQQIDRHAYSAPFPSQQTDCQTDDKIGKGDRHRADGNGERSQHTHHRRHQPADRQVIRRIPVLHPDSPLLYSAEIPIMSAQSAPSHSAVLVAIHTDIIAYAPIIVNYLFFRFTIRIPLSFPVLRRTPRFLILPWPPPTSSAPFSRCGRHRSG